MVAPVVVCLKQCRNVMHPEVGEASGIVALAAPTVPSC